MKRYTLRVRVLDASVTSDRLRMAVDDNLVRLHPRITYHLGRVISTNSETMLVEFVADGSRELIDGHLKKLEEKVPVTVEGLDWGWGGDEDQASETIHNLTKDPLAKIKPGVGPVQYVISKKTILIRYIFILSFTLVLFTLLVAKIYTHRSLALDLTYALVFMIWLSALAEIPVDIRRYAKIIDCGQTELTINRWIKKKAVTLDWQAIWGMEYTYRECKLFGEGKTVRFLLNTGIARPEKETMLKTLIERSSLSFVETTFMKTIYKRSDAPDKQNK